jgi:hypothetical protein
MQSICGNDQGYDNIVGYAGKPLPTIFGFLISPSSPQTPDPSSAGEGLSPIPSF